MNFRANDRTGPVVVVHSMMAMYRGAFDGRFWMIAIDRGYFTVSCSGQIEPVAVET
jgi:hypothetical protein